MLKEKAGEIAGKIWNALNGTEGLTAKQIKKAIQIIIIYNYSHRVTVLQEIYLAYKVAASKDKVLCNPSSHIGVKT